MYKETAISLRDRFLNSDLTALEITEYFCNRAKKLDPQIDSLLHSLSERAHLQAVKLDKKKKDGKALGKLAGVPIIIKDNIQIHGEKTTCASKFLENYVAPFDATVIKLIEEADGIIIAKSNLDEFAMGSSTEHSAYKTTKNPWNLSCTPGGSSGGSAAAVCAMLAPLALGSDTGGSIRQPASFCGLYGFKPTYGRVSRFGLVAFGSSLDQIGPFARSVEDIALMQEVLASHCPCDSNSLNHPKEPYLDELKESIQGKKIGIPYKLLEGLNPEIRAKFDDALDVYKSLGATFVEINLDLINYSIPMYYILAGAEASTNLARFDGIRYTTRSKKAITLEEVYELSKTEGFGSEVKQRILLGTYVLSAGYQEAYYKKAQKVRTLLINEYQKAFESCHTIALPTSPGTAFKLGAIADPLEMYLQDIFTISANLAGIPSINVPIGFDKDNKPIGMQIQGPQLDDARVLRFAHHFEKEANVFSHPPLFDKEVK